jgi:hypothetical protein
LSATSLAGARVLKKLPVKGALLLVTLLGLTSLSVGISDAATIVPWACSQRSSVNSPVDTREAEGPAGCIAVPSGLVSWWPGDGTAMDAMNRNDGTQIGDVTYIAGQVDQAFHLSGSGEIIIPDSASLNPTVQITIEAWVKPVFEGRGIYSDVDVVLGKPSLAPEDLKGYQLSLLMDPSFPWCGATGAVPLGTIQLAINVGGSIQCLVTSNQVPDDNMFHHVAGTYDGSAMRIYLDGIMISEVPVSGAIVPSSSNAHIGVRPNPDLGARADIDEVGLYDRALSSDEVQAIFNAGGLGRCKQDVATVQIVASRNFAYSEILARPIRVNVTVANQGSAAEMFTVTARSNSTLIGSETVTLAAGEMFTIAYDWNTTLAPRGDYVISAESSRVSGEVNVSNNLLTMSGGFEIRKTGDVDGDGDVDIDDLILVWTNQFTPNIPSYYDIDNDEDVDLDDLITTWQHQFT